MGVSSWTSPLFYPLNFNQMKQRIMEALFNVNSGLTKEELAWAAENIPNEGNSTMYDHSKDNLFHACGFSEQDLKGLFEEYVEFKRNEQGTKKSQLVETILTKGSPNLLRKFTIRGILDLEDSISKAHEEAAKRITAEPEFEKLKDLLRSMIKKKD